jgi:2'-5' RNA ligase
VRRRPASAEGGAGIRAFIALTIDAPMQTRVAETVAGLKAKVPDVRWVSTDAYHLTLRFLGSSSPEVLARLEPVLRGAAERCPPSTAPVAGLGMFPERGSPRVLWLGAEVPRAVLELQAACEAAAVASRFPAEGRPFRSHLTLGRWRERAPRPTLPPVDLGTTALDALVLFRSSTRPQGAVYTPLATFPLGRSS